METILENCGTCGTPKARNRFKELDCPKCHSELFTGRDQEETFASPPQTEFGSGTPARLEDFIPSSGASSEREL